MSSRTVNLTSMPEACASTAMREFGGEYRTALSTRFATISSSIEIAAQPQRPAVAEELQGLLLRVRRGS